MLKQLSQLSCLGCGLGGPRNHVLCGGLDPPGGWGNFRRAHPAMLQFVKKIDHLLLLFCQCCGITDSFSLNCCCLQRSSNVENSTYDLYTVPKDSDSQNPDGDCLLVFC